jgi:tRNA-specific 2-thiouridylase
MVQRKRAVVAMSGGVDSSVAAALLVEQGYDVTAMILRLWSEPAEGAASLPAHMQSKGAASLPAHMQSEGACNRCCTPQAVEEARRVAQLLDIPFHQVDAEHVFKRHVVDTFIREHARGRTPNPCLTCNRHIKFGFLLRTAQAAGADYIATGHYARASKGNGTWRLLRGMDPRKDQSYFLFMLNQEQLSHVLFPLGTYTKSQVRAMAAERELPVADREESQDLCFMRDHDLQRFLRAYAPDILQPGPIVDVDGRKLGEHQGLPLYTIGQRRGIGITWSEPLYVLEKDVAEGALVVGPASRLGRRRFRVERLSFVGGQPPSLPAPVTVKIRYTGRPTEAILQPGEPGSLSVYLDTPLRDVTPGQAAVFYRGDVVLGGGLIARGV